MKNRFNRVSPPDYDQAAVMVREAGAQMLARLEVVALWPQRIIDLGCGTGYCTQLLRQRYPVAELLALDDSTSMLEYAKAMCALPVNWMNTALDSLPVEDHSVDLLVVNLLLPWCANLENTLREWRRILRPEGLLMFSSLGPDTLLELPQHVIGPLHLVDMHNLGDMLLHVGFADPVLDVEYFTLTYREPQQLQHELYATGLVPNPHLIGPLQKNAAGLFPVTWEIVYGHAWQPTAAENNMTLEGVVKIPLTQIQKQK